MTSPRWFYPLVAVCLVVLTVASSRHLVRAGRYTDTEGGVGVLDTHTGIKCYPVRCFDLSKPLPQAAIKAPASVPPPRDPFADLAPPAETSGNPLRAKETATDEKNPFDVIEIRK